MTFARYAASAVGAVAILAAGSAVAATFAGPDYPPPGGTTFSGSGNRLNGGGGALWTYSGFDLSASGDLYYAFAGGIAMDGSLTAADGLYYNASASDLDNGVAVFTGVTSVTSFGNVLAVDTRMTLIFKDLANNALALTTSSDAGFSASGLAGGLSGSNVPTLLVLGDFTVRQEVVAKFASGGPYSAAGPFFEGIQGRPPTPGQRVTSFQGGFYSTAVPEPAAWALMISGFGGVGAMLRRRRGAGAATA